MSLKLKNMVGFLKGKFQRLPVRISLLYFIISFFWIMLSDRIVTILFQGGGTRLIANTLKGWVYVIIITCILYCLLERALKRLEAAENRLRKNYEDLSSAHEELEQKEQNIKQNHEELTALYEELEASDEELKQQYEQIHKLAYNDSLTGLPNRLNFKEMFTNIIMNSSSKVALLFIDLDNFKNINDSFGHSFGDVVLVEMSRRLKLADDKNVFVARLGGDEFAIVMNELDEFEQVNEFARKLLLNMVTSFTEKDIHIHMTASIGIAVYPEHADNFEELMKSADTAMYEAKKHGKNQYVFFNQLMKHELYTKVAMESHLRSAVDKNELVLHYQPVFCLKTHKIHGFEALVRWNSSIYGMVSPAAFIPLAEETGLISQIGKWVLRTACSFISRLNDSRQEKLTISVNMSVNQLAEDSLVEGVLNILKEYELEPALLTLEITESILMEDVETNLMKLDSLKKHGVKVALDDFGTGYSSLTYLKKLPISILKLDKAFIDDITNDKIDTDIVRSIINMANTLNLNVTAEGVEKEEQLECLAGFGCDMIQGYYISRPLPEESIEKVLK